MNFFKVTHKFLLSETSEIVSESWNKCSFLSAKVIPLLALQLLLALHVTRVTILMGSVICR